MHVAERTGKWLLVVDDDQDSAESLQILLEELIPGAWVGVAFDGQAGADLAQAAYPPFAVILDMEMPVLDGWGAAARIRAEAPSIPPVLIGVSGNAARLTGALDRGLIDHALVKPIDTDKLLQILQR